MAAAAFAHRGLRSGGNFQFRAALKTTDMPELNGRLGSFWDLRSFRSFLFQTEVGPAFFADGRVTAARLLLDVATLGASRRNGF